MLFSIIMPAYNSQATIKESIASVLNQTYQNFELIIINNNSSDATLSIITNFCHDKRILVINNENNMGVAQSRNRGLEMASGEIIAFLDSDDIWYPNKLEEQYNCFLSGHKIVCSYYDVIDSEGDIIGTRHAPTLVTFEKMLKSNFIGNLTGAYASSFFGKCYQKNIGHEDYIMWLELVKKQPAYCIGNKLAAYRISNNSLSSNKMKLVIWQWKIYRKVLGMNIIRSLYYFLNYIYFAIKKRN